MAAAGLVDTAAEGVEATAGADVTGAAALADAAGVIAGVAIGEKSSRWVQNRRFMAYTNGVISALYVHPRGCYFGIPSVDPWDATRDARLYQGPNPVIAHPPCERWGRYWGGAPTTWPRLIKGNDGGCFASALSMVRKFGGVLEHPEGSAAWPAHGLLRPPRAGGWIKADWIHGFDGWTCAVEQGNYGHRARKLTWLYACGVELPELKWGKADGDFVRLESGFHSKEERARAIKTGACQRLSKNQRLSTPIEFRDLLISIAATAQP